MGVDAEEEADVPGIVPAVQVRGLGEIGVASQQRSSGSRPGGKGAIALSKEAGGHLVRGAVAAAIDQEQRLGGIGQRDDQRMIAPDRRCRLESTPCLHSASVATMRPIGVDDRLVEERGRLLRPRRGAGPR